MACLPRRANDPRVVNARLFTGTRSTAARSRQGAWLGRYGVFAIPGGGQNGGKQDACRALGAWQVGVRFSYLALNDKGIQGGPVYD
jgi:hypothetical protein